MGAYIVCTEKKTYYILYNEKQSAIIKKSFDKERGKPKLQKLQETKKKSGKTVEDWLGKENRIGTDIFNRKYRFEKETFEEFLNRVSGGNAEIRALIFDKKFVPGGRILANRGLEKYGKKITLSNCYVVEPPEDNIESIFECAKKLARTYSYGGGCGIDISNLAPKGARVNNAAKETTGATSFMDLFSLVTQLIGQNGRRGALMISLSCDHPDIEDFIRIKADLDRVTKANISVRFTNAFMEAVLKDTSYELKFKREATGQIVSRKVMARKIFELMAETNWDYAEPGALFWDRISSYNLLSNTKSFSYAGVNPCAEEPLPAGGSCLLGSINLSAFVDMSAEKPAFLYEELKNAVRICTIGMNQVLDEGQSLHPLLEQQKSVSEWRQIGLGIMGLADMLIQLGIRYGSKEAIEFCDKLGFLIADTALDTSADLAKQFGAFPKCNANEIVTTEFFKANASEETREKVKKYGLRNSQILTIAPTGTLSTMLGISGGIEPIFANYYTRKTESLYGKDVYYKVYTKIVDDYMKVHGITDDAELPAYFVTAMSMDFKERIEMQSIWQKHIDASISSTVNVPNEFSVAQVVELYEMAYRKGLKGVTIFRDGCKRTGILTMEVKKDEKKLEIPTAGEGLQRGRIVKVSDESIGKKKKLVTGCGTLHCIAMFHPQSGALLEVYLSKGSTGGCNQFMVGLSRMISLNARAGVDIYTIVDQLNSTGSCPSYAIRSATKHDTSKGACCPMAVGNALLEMYKETQMELKSISAAKEKKKDTFLEKEEEEETVIDKVLCPECGESLIHEGGCVICKSCGWSKCY